jgi:hypothetical protein
MEDSVEWKRTEAVANGRENSNSLLHRPEDLTTATGKPTSRLNSMGPPKQRSGEEFRNHIAGDVGQTEIAALMAESQFLMVKTKAL